jgi:ABC-2 type transport system ATP-binding protein
VRIHFDGDQDMNDRLIAASVENGWKLREIGYDKGMLDDIFKQLSTQTS